MNEEERMQRILSGNSGKYLLAYSTEHNKEIQRGLPVFVEREEAELAAEDMVKDIDVLIECWVEEKIR